MCVCSWERKKGLPLLLICTDFVKRIRGKQKIKEIKNISKLGSTLAPSYWALVTLAYFWGPVKDMCYTKNPES